MGTDKKVVTDRTVMERGKTWTPSVNSSGKDTHTESLCPKNEGTVETEQKPTAMDDRTGPRTLPH
jgi:hypothetical protein